MNIQDAKLILNAADLAGDTVLMNGKHGIGKSQICSQFANEKDMHMETLFLSHQEVGDLIGNPHNVETEDNTLLKWSIPIWLQRMYEASEAGKYCVLFLDELNRAPLDVRQSALQLVLEGQIHEHKLPVLNGKKTLVVAAINPADDYQVDELDPALLDRFLTIDVEADPTTWLQWARENGVNQIVRDFITEHPDRLHWTSGNGGKGATPRSWAKLASFMDVADKIPEEILHQIMKGKVGSEIASQFYSFFKNYVDVVKLQDIEQIVEDNRKSKEKIEDLAELIAQKIEKSEAIQKSELAHQLADKYVEEDDMLPFHAYLYALDIEICVAFLKGFQKDNPKGYKKLALADDKANAKNLFKRIIAASERKD